ncbi:hypothetical protein [Burkholderia gladioli]|uniref:hypothetical protein n=1 Tax=Burkholderia gladioli TaxID=28095 RepID=UPI0016415881|nr:hypothetical protein [Burkholderia gladioli]
MATIVDALVVTLGLDAAAFKRGKAEASQATKKLTAEELAAAKQIEANNKRAADSFRRVRTEVLALVGLFTAGLGLTAFTVNTIKTAAALDRMSSNLDMSARDLASWQLAARNAGGTVEGITSALADSQKQVAGLKYGQVSESMQWFLRLGGSMSDLKDGNTYLLARSRIIANMFKVDPGRARFIAQQMGISDDAFNLLKQGPEAVQRYRDQQAALAEEMARAAAPAEALRKQFDLLETKLQSVAVAVLTELMPVFRDWVQAFDRIAKWIADHRDDIRNWVQSAIGEIEKFAKMANSAAEAVGGWQNVLLALLGLKVLSIVSPLLQLGAALGGVGSGLAQIALVGPAALAALGLLLEKLRRDALDRAIPPGPNHDQQVVEAQAGGIVTPDVGEHNAGSWGRLGAWFQNAKKHPPRGVRNNNPGNLKYGDFAYQQGATGRDSDGFAVFPTMEAGVAAQRALLGLYLRQGNDTIRKVVSKYAPSSENDTTGYIADVARKLGISPDQRLTTANIAALSDAMIAREVGVSAAALGGAGSRAAFSAPGSTYPFSIYSGIPGAADLARNVALAASVPSGAGGGATHTSTSTAETHINGPITVTTQATDATGIARDLGSALKRYNFTVAQANTGTF